MGFCIDKRQMKLSTIFVVLSVALLKSLVVDGFNLDAFNYAVYDTQQDSMFGFTVAVHKQGPNRGWILVGAPEAQSQYQGDQVRRGGVVYKCRTDGDDQCQEIPFDRDGNKFFGNREMDQKSGQWFGATLSTSRNPSGGPVVACAPRYVWYSKEMNRRDPVGTCFVSDAGFEKFEEYSPCRTSNWGYHRQGSCQAGFSASINSIGDRLFIGAPGSYYWQGQMYSVDAHSRFNYTPGSLGTTYGAKGSAHQQSLETRPAVFQTREGQQRDDDSYMGYSTLVGDFLNNGEQGVAVGMPRGAELYGKVLLFTWNLTNYKNISSSQLGSYFGYSLTAADVDGDNKLDLIVGAPMHTEANTQGKYDVGRVYVFYQGGAYGSFHRSSFIDGINSKSRFGHSVAYLGDLNLDGYDDFAVGAPYDGPFNRGAVYIYYGSANGVLEKYGQVIYAEDVFSTNRIPVNTFGFSVTGGLDMDGNGYPDMAVGAYLSNSAFFFRSRPVVRVESFLRFRTENKKIDIKNKNCNLPNGQRGTCTTIDFCIKYSGKGLPQQIGVNVQYILDTKKPNIPRMAFLTKNTNILNETITLHKDSQEACQTKEIYIKNEIRDKLTQLEVEVKYFMIQEDRDASYYYRVRNPKSQLKPVLDQNLPSSRKDSISIQNNCGSDNICVPNLHVNVTKNVEKYLLGSNTNLEFDIIVSNFKEDSFETTLYLSYPEGIYFKRMEKKEDIVMQGILCGDGKNRTIACDIGNPLPANKITAFRMIFVPYYKQGMSPSYEFDVHVNSSNPDENTTLQDNYQHVTVDIWVNSALDVSGRSIPQEMYLPNSSQYPSELIENESDIGPQVTHLYTLKNEGPATIYEAEMYFLWPWQTLAGEDLMYLLDQPHVPEGVKCEIPVPANYKNYKLDYHPKSIWERLHIDSSSHDKSHKYSSVTIGVSGRNIAAVAGGTRVKGSTSKLDEEILSSSGDASTIYEKRQNESLTSTSQSAQGNGWAAGSEQDSTGHNSTAGETVYTKSEWRTTVVNGLPVTKWTKVTTIKDATGKIVKTVYSTDESSDQLSASSNVDSFGQKIGQQEYVKYEERIREERRRLDEMRIAEERARQKVREEQIRVEEERRRQQGIIDEQRRRQRLIEEERHRQQQQQRDDEIRRRQEDELRHQIEERLRQYELEETRRLEEEVRRHGDQHQSGASSSWQQGGSRNRSSYGGPTGTGYFDSHGNYHDESSAAAGRGGSEVVFNRTWTVEGTADVDDAESSRGGHSTGNQLNSGQRNLSGTLDGGFSEEDEELLYSSEWQRNWWEDVEVDEDVPTDRPDLSRHRGRRQARETDPDIDDLLKCTAARCFYVKCVVGTLKKDEFISIALRSRLNVRAVRHLSTTQPLKLSSMMLARVSKLPYIGKPKEQALYSHEIFTDIPAGAPKF